MISKLRGTVDSLTGQTLTIDVQGVGYEVTGTGGLIEGIEVGSTVSVLIYTDVKEDSIRLFGFASQLERQVFLLLLRVTGIGSRTALDIVSGIESRELLRAIGSGDTGRIQQIKGVGKKTAERMILELRDKVSAMAVDLHDTGASQMLRGATADAVEALAALGFSRPDAETAVRAALNSCGENGADFDAGSLVKEALRFV